MANNLNKIDGELNSSSCVNSRRCQSKTSDCSIEASVKNTPISNVTEDIKKEENDIVPNGEIKRRRRGRPRKQPTAENELESQETKKVKIHESSTNEGGYEMKGESRQHSSTVTEISLEEKEKEQKIDVKLNEHSVVENVEDDSIPKTQNDKSNYDTDSTENSKNKEEIIKKKGDGEIMTKVNELMEELRFLRGMTGNMSIVLVDMVNSLRSEQFIKRLDKLNIIDNELTKMVTTVEHVVTETQAIQKVIEKIVEKTEKMQTVVETAVNGMNRMQESFGKVVNSIEGVQKVLVHVSQMIGY